MIFLKLFPAILLTILIAPSSAYAEKKEVEKSITGTKVVSAEEVFDLYEDFDDLVIIDSRKPADRANGYIEGSVALPDFDTNEASLAEHLPSNKTPVVFYCNGIKCGRSGNAAKIAVKLSYESIYWFRGGWEEWMANEYPFVKD